MISIYRSANSIQNAFSIAEAMQLSSLPVDSDDNSMSEIEEGLFLSSVHSALNRRILNENCIQTILTIVDFQQETASLNFSSDILCFYIKLNNNNEEELLLFLDKTFEIISEARNAKRNILVNCQFGRAQSAAIVIGYLMKSKNLTYLDAFMLVKQKRNSVEINSGFRQQLRLYEGLGYNLNLEKIPFKSYVLSRIQEAYWHFSSSGHTIARKYLEIFQDFQRSQTTYPIYCCKKCNKELCDQNDIIKVDKKRHLFYIYPVPWIVNQTQYEIYGKYRCPECNAMVGGYNWQGVGDSWFFQFTPTIDESRPFNHQINVSKIFFLRRNYVIKREAAPAPKPEDVISRGNLRYYQFGLRKK